VGGRGGGGACKQRAQLGAHLAKAAVLGQAARVLLPGLLASLAAGGALAVAVGAPAVAAVGGPAVAGLL
jgi:hypothetical protein